MAITAPSHAHNTREGKEWNRPPSAREPDPSVPPMMAFFAIPELLEQVLAFLPLRDLLLVQRVCQQFHRLVTTSPRLQRLLFFRPDVKRVTPDRNDLLTVLFSRVFRWKAGKILSFTRTNFRWMNDQRKRDAVLRASASWRRMLLTQPPVPFTFDWVTRGVRRARPAIEVPEEINNGPYMGALWDVLAELLVRNDGPKRCWVQVSYIDGEDNVHRILRQATPLRKMHFRFNTYRYANEENSDKLREQLLSEAHNGADMFDRMFKDAEWTEG